MEIQLSPDDVLKAVVERIYRDFIPDSDRYYAQITETINKRITKAVDEHLSKVIPTTIDKVVEDLMKEGFNKQFQSVDAFGRPVGEPWVLSKKLERIISEYWNEPVDKNGKAAGRDSYGVKMTRAEYLMSKICTEDFTKQSKQVIVNMTAAFKDGLRAELRAQTDKMLHECFRVISSQDKAEGRAY